MEATCRICPRCKDVFPMDSFPIRKKSGGERREIYCPECTKLYRREHYENNKDRYKDNVRAYREKTNIHPEFKICSVCDTFKPIDEFRARMVNGRKYFRKECKICYDKIYPRIKSVGAKKRATEKRKITDKMRRKSGDHMEVFILKDSRSSDRKRNMSNDLDLVFIESIISQSCCYCGEDKIPMSLDRIDNSIGHLKGNVVPSCRRCNFARRDMPHAAWLVIAKSMREARELGLFGDWIGGNSKRLSSSDGESTAFITQRSNVRSIPEPPCFVPVAQSVRAANS